MENKEEFAKFDKTHNFSAMNILYWLKWQCIIILSLKKHLLNHQTIESL